MRAMIAMSGGVDSSVAALLMKEAGYDCTGITMRLYRESGYQTSCEKSCCSDADEENAALVCWQLFKAVDEKKDQSYVLYMLTQEQLRYLRFPLGVLHKDETRQLAQAHKLVNAEKRDSQDICFIPDGDYAGFIRRRTGMPYPDGDILEQNGDTVGRHHGLLRYTIGQRRSLGLSAGEPRYVIGKDPVNNTLLIGPEAALYRRDLLAFAFNWLSIPKPAAPILAFARTRYHQHEAACTVYPLSGDEVRIVFDEPRRAISPGQAVVLYREDMVLGGGTISDFPTGVSE